jgi:pyruvate formate lyase activating enzyme
MRIGGLSTLSTIDYPGKIAGVVFTQGCNFSCKYCHNAELIPKVVNGVLIPEDEALKELEKRKNVLEGVCVTGGEPTVQDEYSLRSFLRSLKKLGFNVKLDTNGSNPGVVRRILEMNLADYVAVDLKGWMDGYMKVGRKEGFQTFMAVMKTIDCLAYSGVPYEIRTTCDRRYVREDDIRILSEFLERYRPKWFLQEARPPGEPYLAVDNLVEIAKKKVEAVYRR